MLLLSIFPIAVIICMLVIFKKSADISGIAGLVSVSAVAFLFFNTSVEVIFRSIASGLIKSFPVSLIVSASLLQMAFMESTGALKRIIIFIKTIARDNQAVQVMIINIGFGTLMVAVGATPVSLLPPILLAMGYSTYVSIALPAIGYDSLCTYALLGAPIVVFVDMTNQYLSLNPINNIHSLSLSDAGSIFFMFLPVVSTFIGFSMLWIIGKWKAVRQGVLPCLITGITIGIVSYFTNKSNHLVALTGIMCGISVIFVMILYLMFTGKKVIDKSLLTMDEIDYEKKYPLWKAALPWILLIILILALNLPDFMFQILYRKLTFPISGVSANRKEIISTRFLWNAYTWIFVSTIVSIPFLKPTKTQLKDTVKVWFKRSLRPVFSSAVFFSVGEVMNMSGFNILRQKYVTDSMVKILADSSASFFRGTYGCIVSFIGLLGGFITGSEASTIAMFGKYSMATASNLNIGLRGLIIVTAGIAFGGGLASVISPAKLQNAAASIDKLGEENQIIRMAFVFSIILTAITSLVVVLLLAL